mmetsp:Transcript_19530/g.58845  ORF Transcript_19530/g.58845 Transcript_19530/m.58845 type:complete len:205 (-) Transcript_19530:1214-1828(-)
MGLGATTVRLGRRLTPDAEQCGTAGNLQIVPALQTLDPSPVDGAVAVEGSSELPADGRGRVGVAEEVGAPDDGFREIRGIVKAPQGHGKTVHAVGPKVVGSAHVAVVEVAAAKEGTLDVQLGSAPVPALFLAADGLRAPQQAHKLLAVPCTREAPGHVVFHHPVQEGPGRLIPASSDRAGDGKAEERRRCGRDGARVGCRRGSG